MKKPASAFSLIEISIVLLIVSLLAGGILISSKLIKKSRLQTARLLTTNSPVNNIPNLVAWFETSLESSFAENERSDGNTISNWYDNNPNAASRNNASQTTSANQPLFITNIFNGALPAIRFDGTNDHLLFKGSALINSPYTIFAVEQRRSGKNSNYFLGGTTNSGANTELALGYRSTSMATQAHVGNDLDYPGIAAYSTPSTVIHTYTLNTMPSQPNSGKRYWINGSGNSSTTNVANSSQTAPITSFVGSNLGRHVTAYFEGDLAEVIIFNRNLTATERLSIDDYLGKKYNIAVTTS